MYKFIFIVFLTCFIKIGSQAQGKIDSSGISLQKLAVAIQEGTIISNRFKADSIFTRNLVQVLKTPFSFNFRFDSLIAIKQIVSPDKAFKIFSWQLDLGDGTYRQRAALQFPSSDGALRLLPLFDNSDFIVTPTKGVNNRKNWIGAIYYDIIPTAYKNQTYYTLLGYDEFNLTVSRKIIEVIHFEHDEPIFGGDFFNYPPDETYPSAPVDRFLFTYKKGSNAYIRYDSETKHLILSELTSTDKDLKATSTLVPSGNEVYFEWKNGKWVMPASKASKNNKAH